MDGFFFMEEQESDPFADCEDCEHCVIVDSHFSETEYECKIGGCERVRKLLAEQSAG